MNAAGERMLTRWLLAGVLLAGLGLLWLLAGGDRRVHWSPPGPLPPMPAQAASVPAATVPALLRFSAIWQRPLLSPDRQPLQPRGEGRRLGDLELTGVIISPGLKLALLRPRPGSGPAGAASAAGGLRVALGARTPDGGWQLTRLEPRQAWFSRDGRQLRLALMPAAAASVATRPAMSSSPAGPDEALEQQRREALRQALQRLRAQPPAASAASGTH